MAYTPGLVRITMGFTLAGGQAAAIVQYAEKQAGVPLVTELDDLANGTILALWEGFYNGNVGLQQIMVAAVEFTGVRVTAVGVIPQFEHFAPGGDNGSVVGGALPPETALVVSHRTAFVGRSFRGRNYIPGLGEAATVDSGLFNAGTLAAVEDIWVDWRQDLNEKGYDHVVFSDLLSTATPVTSSTARAVPHHQSRRNP